MVLLRPLRSSFHAEGSQTTACLLSKWLAVHIIAGACIRLCLVSGRVLHAESWFLAECCLLNRGQVWTCTSQGNIYRGPSAGLCTECTSLCCHRLLGFIVVHSTLVWWHCQPDAALPSALPEVQVVLAVTAGQCSTGLRDGAVSTCLAVAVVAAMLCGSGP